MFLLFYETLQIICMDVRILDIHLTSLVKLSSNLGFVDCSLISEAGVAHREPHYLALPYHSSLTLDCAEAVCVEIKKLYVIYLITGTGKRWPIKLSSLLLCAGSKDGGICSV